MINLGGRRQRVLTSLLKLCRRCWRLVLLLLSPWIIFREFMFSQNHVFLLGKLNGKRILLLISFKEEGFRLLIGVFYAIKTMRRKATFFFTVLQLECFRICSFLFLASLG